MRFLTRLAVSGKPGQNQENALDSVPRDGESLQGDKGLEPLTR